MTSVHITIDKAPNLAAAEQRAYEIADQFYSHGEGVRDYHLEQEDAYPEQEVVTVTTTNGVEREVATTPVTFYVKFVARWLS